MTTTACGLPAGCHSRVKILMPSTPLKLPSVMVESPHPDAAWRDQADQSRGHLRPLPDQDLPPNTGSLKRRVPGLMSTPSARGWPGSHGAFASRSTVEIVGL